MPNRPGRNRVFNPIYNPVRLPETTGREFLPVRSCNVNSGLPTNNNNPLTNFHSGGGQQYYGLIQIDLTGYYAGFVDFVAAGFAFGGTGATVDAGVIRIGIMNPNDIASWTASATWNTKDGATAWTSGAGGFLQPSTEISYTAGAMPGVVTAGKTLVAAEGSFPTKNMYHSRYDPNFPAEAFANLCDAAIAQGLGKINLYIYTSSNNTWACRPGTTTALEGEKFRFVTWSRNINPGLGFIGTEGTLWPPLDAYLTAPAVNAGQYGSPSFDMCSVDPANVTHNWHGGTGGGTFVYRMEVNTATGASDDMVLMHFDLSEFIGKTFSSVKLRYFCGCTTAGGAVNNVRNFVAQSAYSWAVGNGGGAASTRGPTWTLQEKLGAIAWPGAINVGSAAFIDTVGQAETASGTVYNGGGTTAFNNLVDIDITAMANRALSTYNGHLYLRVRTSTDTLGTGGWPTAVAGPTSAGLLSTYNAALTQSTSPTIAGYRTFPHLRLKTS